MAEVMGTRWRSLHMVAAISPHHPHRTTPYAKEHKCVMPPHSLAVARARMKERENMAVFPPNWNLARVPGGACSWRTLERERLVSPATNVAWFIENPPNAKAQPTQCSALRVEAGY